MTLTESDIINTRSEAQKAHQLAKLSLQEGKMPDLESQRDDCEEKRNAVQSVVNYLEDQLEAYRKQKRAIDDKMADVKSLQREFSGLSADLATASKRCNSMFWDLKKGRKPYEPTPSQQ